MKLYHVSYDPIWFFNPRVPKSRLPMEDAEHPVSACPIALSGV